MLCLTKQMIKKPVTATWVSNINQICTRFSDRIKHYWHFSRLHTPRPCLDGCNYRNIAEHSSLEGPHEDQVQSLKCTVHTRTEPMGPALLAPSSPHLGWSQGHCTPWLQWSQKTSLSHRKSQHPKEWELHTQHCCASHPSRGCWIHTTLLLRHSDPNFQDK